MNELGEIGWEGVDWTYLVQYSDHWQVLVNVVTNCQVP